MRFSVVITTLNRSDLLIETLKCYERQDFDKKQFELVVVDDGSVPDSEKLVSDFRRNSGLNVSYVWQENKGLASARNTGVRLARGDYILLSTDDIMPLDADFLSQHDRVHLRAEGVACLGPNLWHPKLDITEAMRFLAPNGPAFDYGAIKNPNNCGYKFFMGNVSLHRSWFSRELFDENFIGASFDDIEFGYRVCKQGLRIVYNPDARLYHYHHYKTFGEFYNAILKRKSGYDYMIEKHPELKKPVVRICASGLLALLGWISFKITGAARFKYVYWRYMLNYQVFRRW